MSEQGFSVRLTARIDQYLASMQQAAAATKNVSAAGTDLDKLGGQFMKVGKTMTRYVSLPIVAAGGLAIKMSSDFESAFARMEGLAGVEAGEVEGLKKAVLALAGETAKAPQELADALYEASSAGLSTAQALDAVKVAARASAAGMGSAQDVVGLVASATAAYGEANITAARATDILTATIREGRADPAELAGTLGRVLPIANQLGVSFEEVGGATAYLSNVFGDTNRTVTALQGFLVKLVSPTEQGRKALLEMGTSAAELRSAIDKDGLMGALQLLKTHGFDQNDQAMTKLFDDIEGRQGALALMADESGKLAGIMDATANSAGSLDSAFALVAETSGFKMRQAWADVQVALIKAGDIIMPIVAGVAGAIASLATTFSDLPGPVQKIIVVFLGLLAAAGPLLIVAGSMIKNFKEVKSVMGGLGSGASAAVGPLAILAVVVYGLSQRANHAADEIRKIGEAAAALSTVGDDQVMVQLWQAISQGVIAGQDLTTTMKQLAEANIDGARRALEMAEAQGADEKIIVALRRAVVDKMRADDEAAAATDRLTGSTGALAAGQSILQAAVLGAAAAAGDLNAVLPPTEEQLKAIAETEKANAEATKSMSKALADSTNIFEQLASAASILDKALHDVFNPIQNLEDTQQALNQAVAATTQSIKDNGTTLDIATEKGNKNRDAIQAQADAAMAHGVAMVGMGSSTAEATDFINFNIAALHNQLIAAGLTEDQVNDYLTTLGLTPENVNTAITLADTEATKLRIKDLQERLGDIDAGAAALITADIEQGKFDEAESKLKWIARVREVQLNLTAGTGLRLIWAEGTMPLVRFGATSMGGYFDREQIRSFAEGGHPEAALPLDNPGQMQSLLSDPRIGGPVAAAMPGGWSGPPASSSTVNNQTAVVNNNHQPVTVDVISRALAMARLAA